MPLGVLTILHVAIEPILTCCILKYYQNIHASLHAPFTKKHNNDSVTHFDIAYCVMYIKLLKMNTTYHFFKHWVVFPCCCHILQADSPKLPGGV